MDTLEQTALMDEQNRSEDELPLLKEQITPETEFRITEYIKGLKGRSEQYYSGKRTRWLDYFDHYINKKRAKTRTTIPVPLAQEAVDVTLADLMGKFFATKPFCSARGRNEQDQMRAPMIEKILDYQFQKMGIFDTAYQITKSALIYGSCPFRVVYDQNVVEIPVPGTPYAKRVVQYSGPMIHVYDIFDYFPAPAKTDINDATPDITRTYRTYEYLEERADVMPDVYFNVSKIPHKRIVNMETDDINTRQHRLNALGMSPEATERGLVEVLECSMPWPFYKKDGTRMRVPCLFTVANGQLIRATRNNYVSQDNNMGLAVIDRVPGDLFGMGLIEKMHPQIHGANTVLDMILVALELGVDPMLLFSEDRVKRQEQLHNRAGGTIGVRGDNVQQAVAWLQGANVTTDAYNVLGIFTSQGESSSGVKPIKKSDASFRTATANLMAGQEAGSRFNLFMLMLENSFVRQAATRMHKINQQFMDLPQLLPILENDAQKWQVVDEQTIAIDPDFIVEGTRESANKEMEVAQLEHMLALLSANPALLPITPFIVGRLARAMRLEDADKIQQLAEGSVQQFMMSQAAEQGGGTNGGGGRISQIGGADNMAGMKSTNTTDLLQSMGSQFGPSAFN